MRDLRAWSALFILLLVCRGMLAQASDGAVVEGRIVNKDISGAIVRLQKEPIDPLAYIDGYSAVVEADGSFRFHDIPPGAYRLTGEAKEWKYGEYGSHSPGQAGTIFRVEAGTHLRSLELKLFQAPETICGYVVDSTGEPLQVNVEEYSVRQQDDAQRLYPEQPTRRTDSNGYFSFQKVGRERGYFIRAGGVWYPSTRDFAQAVQLAPAVLSASGCQANIHIANESCTGRVSAKPASSLQCPVNEYEVSLYGVNPSGPLFLADKTLSGLDEGAEFEGVCGGSYVVVAKQKGYCRGQKHWQQLASPVFQLSGPNATVALNDTTIQEIERIGAAKEHEPLQTSLTGTLHFEGLTAGEACPTHPGLWARITNADAEYAAVPDARINPQGNFEFDKAKPGTYRLSFSATMHGAMYLKSFKLDGHEEDPTRLKILSGHANHVEAVFSNDPGSAAGHLHADNAAPLHFLPEGMYPKASVSGKVTGGAAGGVTVSLSSIRYNSAESTLYQTHAGADGSFHFESVDPGLYRLFAEGGAYQRSAYGAKGPGLEGAPVAVTAGQRLKDLPITLFGIHLLSPKPEERTDSVKNALGPLSTLEGKILIDEKMPSGDLRSLDPALLMPTAMFEWPGRDTQTEAQLDSQGHFTFKNLQARDYGFHIFGLWGDNYVKSMQLDGKPVNGTRIRLGSGQSAHLVVHLASDGASGTVTPGPTQIPIDEYEDDCRNWGGRPLMVMMIPDVLPADNSGILVGGFQTNGQNVWDGVFHYHGVPPGRYHLLALDLLDHIQGRLMGAGDAVFENHYALVKLGLLGKAVEVDAKQHFEWVAPVVTEQMMRLKAELGLPAWQ